MQMGRGNSKDAVAGLFLDANEGFTEMLQRDSDISLVYNYSEGLSDVMKSVKAVLKKLNASIEDAAIIIAIASRADEYGYAEISDQEILEISSSYVSDGISDDKLDIFVKDLLKYTSLFKYCDEPIDDKSTYAYLFRPLGKIKRPPVFHPSEKVDFW